MQLVAYGAQDVYLTGNPQITFWKVTYRRYTNFAIESIEQTFNGQADFGRRVQCVISRNGDLAYRTYCKLLYPRSTNLWVLLPLPLAKELVSMLVGWITPASKSLLRLRSRLVVNELIVNMVTGCTSGTSLQ
jgi:hypothetical protein